MAGSSTSLSPSSSSCSATPISSMASSTRSSGTIDDEVRRQMHWLPPQGRAPPSAPPSSTPAVSSPLAATTPSPSQPGSAGTRHSTPTDCCETHAVANSSRAFTLPSSTENKDPAAGATASSVPSTTTSASRPEVTRKGAYVCSHPGCCKSYKRPHHLQRHMRTHSEPQFRCTVVGCNRGFHRRDHFDYHMLTHTDERPFVCPEDGCGKTFRQRSGLQRHQESHERLRDRTCSFCRRSFSSRAALTTHLAVAHSGALEAARAVLSLQQQEQQQTQQQHAQWLQQQQQQQTQQQQRQRQWQQ